jgi:hypothetical protein
MAFDRGDGSTGTGGTSVLTIDRGGTGADNAAQARTNLGIDAFVVADGAITTAKLADSAVTEVKLFNSSVTAAKIANGAVTDIKLATDSVTNTKIGTSAVTETKIASDAVTTAKILDSNVTAGKLAATLDLSSKTVTLGTVPFADGTALLPSVTNTGDLNTGVFFPAADTVGISTGGVEQFRVASDGQLSAVVPSGSTLYPSFTARAWVNFNGTGTPVANASGNVSSIGDLGTGSFRVNLTTAMPDTNYSAVGSSHLHGTGSTTTSVDANTTSIVDVYTYTIGTSTLVDANPVSVAVFR